MCRHGIELAVGRRAKEGVMDVCTCSLSMDRLAVFPLSKDGWKVRFIKLLKTI